MCSRWFVGARALVGCLAILAFGLFGPPVFAQLPTGDAALTLPIVAQRLADVKSLRIIAFGSSSTEGIGASSPAAAYPPRLQSALSGLLPGDTTVTVLNRGVGGEDADDMLKRLPQVLAEHPDLVIWQTGSNDPLRSVPIDRFVEETDAGIRLIRAAGADIMLMEPQLCRVLATHAEAVEYRDAIRKIGANLGVTVIRRFDLMRAWLASGALTPEQMLSPDGLHMADAGYARLADTVAQTIVRQTGVSRVLVASPLASR